MISKEQKRIFHLVKAFVLENIPNVSPNARLALPSTLPARDRLFLTDLADELHLTISYDEFDEANFSIIVLSFDEDVLELARLEEDDSESSDADPEWVDAIHRVLKKYGKAHVTKDLDEAEIEDSHAKQLDLKMTSWKKEYYKVSAQRSCNENVVTNQRGRLY